jgi:hypothetical protein
MNRVYDKNFTKQTEKSKLFFSMKLLENIIFFRFIMGPMSSSISSSIELSSLVSSNNEYTVDKIRFRSQHHKSNFDVIDNAMSKFKSK